MNNSTAIVFALILLCDLLLVSSSRMMHCIRVTAVQGLLLGIIPFAVRGWAIPEIGSSGMYVMAFVNTFVKCAVLPALLLLAMRRANVKRELEPMLGYAASVLIFMLLTASAFAIGGRLSGSSDEVAKMATPVAVSTMFAGLLLIISRKKALTQVIGFLVFENGIAVFGNGLMLEYGLLVELGILLDVFVLVFIMGIAVFHISREFSHIDSDRMHSLGDIHNDTTEASAAIFSNHAERG